MAVFVLAGECSHQTVRLTVEKADVFQVFKRSTLSLSGSLAESGVVVPTADAYPQPGDRVCYFRSGDQLPQGPLVVWEIAGVQHLDAGRVVPVEGGCRARASRRHSIFR
jgi:hypothetical protein